MPERNPNQYSSKSYTYPRLTKDVAEALEAYSYVDPSAINRAISEIKYLRRVVELEKNKKSGEELKLEEEILKLISYIDHLLLTFDALAEDDTYTFPDGHVWEV